MSVAQSKTLHGIVVFLFFFIGMVHAADLPPLTHSLTPVQSSQKLPPLRLKNMDDEIVDIAELRGKVVVVNFWATWCPPCRREMGSLERLNLATADKGVVVLAVNIGEDVDTVFSFLGTVDPSPSFPILFDTDSGSMDDWKVMGLPTTYIIDPSGTIGYRAVGGREFDHPELVKRVVALTER
jgi:thiol-disulfide isomerase/thioredoxin